MGCRLRCDHGLDYFKVDVRSEPWTCKSHSPVGSPGGIYARTSRLQCGTDLRHVLSKIGKVCLMEIAKWLVAFVAVFNFGGLVADAIVPGTAKQHLWNPHWPPHAKFHNGQTMLMGIFGGLLSLAILFGGWPLTLPLFLLAAAVAASYFVSMALAPMFPGTGWTDPDFIVETPRPLGLAPQQLVTYVLCAIVLLAVVLASLAR